jgi:hypothetical protein
MTEAEWLACTDLKTMLEFLRGRTSDRKLRLFACACCRRAWAGIGSAEGRMAVETAERYAEGLAGEHELLEAHALASTVAQGEPDPDDGLIPVDAGIAAAAAAAARTPEEYKAATLALNAVARTEDRLTATPGERLAEIDAEYDAQVALLQEIVGNPFRSLFIDPAILRWKDGAALKLAQRIYDDRAFDRLPVLADALEEAGCDNADILAHCRQPGDHVRGCWAVDLILGKE